MEDKIKGLEKAIQAYIDNNPDCKVKVTYQRVVSDYVDGIKQNGFKWTVFVSHFPKDI